MSDFWCEGAINLQDGAFSWFKWSCGLAKGGLGRFCGPKESEAGAVDGTEHAKTQIHARKSHHATGFCGTG